MSEEDMLLENRQAKYIERLETRLRELEMADLGNNITFKSMDIALSHIETENIVLKKELEELRKANGWQPIECFDGDMFVLLTNGMPEYTTVYKYKGHIPEWATHWKPITAPKKCGE